MVSFLVKTQSILGSQNRLPILLSQVEIHGKMYLLPPELCSVLTLPLVVFVMYFS